MLDIKTILCPVDFSEASDRAMRYALYLAGALNARVHLFHVYEMSEYIVPENPVVRPELLPAQVQAARDQFATFVKEHDTGDVPVTSSMKEGVARKLILEAAHEHLADLIVMGSHGRSGVARLMLGSVAERIVRAATVPVLVVRDGEQDD
jgi:nucleotide-binding universal stress UspA family protein